MYHRQRPLGDLGIQKAPTHLIPDILVEDPVAISTRVAPSFLRVGQLELFARRARTRDHPDVLKELRMIVLHLIDREYKSEIDQTLDFPTQLIQLAELYRDRLTNLGCPLVTHWLLPRQFQ